MAKKNISDFIAAQAGLNIETPHVRKGEREPVKHESPKQIKKMGRPVTKGRGVNSSIYTSKELKESLIDIQFHRRISSFNDLINDILEEYVKNYNYRR